MWLIACVDGFCWLYLLALVIVFVAGLAVVWIWDRVWLCWLLVVALRVFAACLLWRLGVVV